MILIILCFYFVEIDPHLVILAFYHLSQCTTFVQLPRLALWDISERIELNARNNFGMTAFMWACKKGHKDVVNFFLDHSERIDLNDKDVLGRTALMIANQEGHQDIVQLISAKLNL